MIACVTASIVAQSESPPAFVALTLKLYAVSEFRPVIVAIVPAGVVAVVHVESDAFLYCKRRCRIIFRPGA